MSQFSQFRYSQGNPAGGFFGRVLALILGVIMLGVAVFVGAIFIAGMVGLLLLGGLLITARVWWLKRKMERYEAEHGDLDAEYTVIQESDQHIDKQD